MNFKLSLNVDLIEGQQLAHQGRWRPGLDEINSTVITHCFALMISPPSAQIATQQSCGRTPKISLIVDLVVSVTFLLLLFENHFTLPLRLTILFMRVIPTMIFQETDISETRHILIPQKNNGGKLRTDYDSQDLQSSLLAYFPAHLPILSDAMQSHQYSNHIPQRLT